MRVGFLMSAAAVLAGCGQRESGTTRDAPPQVYRGEMRFGLSFEERMAIPPEVSRVRAEAQRRAQAVYDPFQSQEQAVRYEAYSQALVEESLERLLERHGLTREEFDAIEREYQHSLGANIR